MSTFAGNGSTGSTNGPAATASFNQPYGVAVDASGNVYVADMSNNLIREISGGVVSTLAGSAGVSGSTNGTGTAASFYLPHAVAVDSSGNVYVADTFNNLIREITPGGVVSTFAGTSPTFYNPYGVAVDTAGNVYVGDSGNNLIRKITSGGVVTTLAGSGSIGSVNGTGTAATFTFPTGVAVDTSGNVYVSDEGNNKVREITAGGVVSTLAGSGSSGSTNGPASSASFFILYGIAVDASGYVYVADSANSLIREIQ